MVGVVTGDAASSSSSSPSILVSLSSLTGRMFREAGMRLVSMTVVGKDVLLGEGRSTGLCNGDLNLTLLEVAAVVPLSRPSKLFGKALLIGPKGLDSKATDPTGFLLTELSILGLSSSDDRGENIPAPGKLLRLCCVSALPIVSGLSSVTELGPFLTDVLAVVESPPSLIGEMISILSICSYRGEGSPLVLSLRLSLEAFTLSGMDDVGSLGSCIGIEEVDDDDFL